ncbi:MAG: NADH-quinone oxidoreductase subunit NuoE [Deltaproteobacteria bacterium]|nr:NADH-quinone oxidoreductase subunit NuoE [Deltaproteobacteria bacterium]
MLSDALKETLRGKIAQGEHPREHAVDVMLEIQKRCGYMSDEAMEEAATLLGMSPLELEELATFYDHIYREPVGKYVIRVCDSAVCWMHGHLSVVDHLTSLLGIGMGETTPDGLFTVLPVCCLGYCDRAPAMMINQRIFGQLTPEKIDRVIRRLREEASFDEAE